MSAISDNLIHFLARHEKESPNKQFEVFKLIIEKGLQTSSVLIKFDEGSAIFNKIICFTDIPLRECNEHTSVYGKFGIGFRKSYVKNAGGNPARYFLDYMPGQLDDAGNLESRGALYFNLCAQHKFLIKLKDYEKANPICPLFDDKGIEILSTDDVKRQIATQIFCLSFEKEMGDLGPARDETKEIDLFYKEREWRLVPSYLSDKTKASIRSSNGDNHYYLFQRSDLNMIVVPNEEMRLSVLDYFLALRASADVRLKQFGDNPLPIINYDDLHKW